MVNISGETFWSDKKITAASNQNPSMISNYDRITFFHLGNIWNDFGLNSIKRCNSKSNKPQNIVPPITPENFEIPKGYPAIMWNHIDNRVLISSWNILHFETVTLHLNQFATGNESRKPPLKLLSPSDTRWLIIADCSERVLMQVCVYLQF